MKILNTPFLVFFFVCCFFLSLAKATEQVTDVLVIRGKRVYTHEMPSLKQAFPKLKIPDFQMMSTANYKGYNATWAVIQGELYLIGLEALMEENGTRLWDEKVLVGQKFPIKVEDWTGVVTESSPVSSFDPNTGKSEIYDEVTKIVFAKSKVTEVAFHVKTPRKSNILDE